MSMMKRPMRRVTIFAIILVSLMFLSGPGCGNQWLLFYNKPIKGMVIEDKTGRPLEGTIVVGMWRLSQFLSQGFGGYAKVIEVETDREGKFNIPWWITFKPWKFYSAMHDLAPEIIIYKPGYEVYHSHKLEREGFPKDITLTLEQKQATREQYGINPARLKKIYTDEERAKNIMKTKRLAWLFEIGDGLHKSDVKQLLIALEKERMSLPDKLKNELPENN